MSPTDPISRFLEECHYCADLIATGGNRSVPAGAMRSYFAVQAAQARRAGLQGLASIFSELASGQLAGRLAIARLRGYAGAPIGGTNGR